MKKALFFFIVTLFIKCGNLTSKQDILKKTKEVVFLQKEAGKSSGDSIFYYLKKAEKILNNYSEISDTLFIENTFLKGYYYKQKNNLDSARFFFHKTIDFVKKPNNRARNRVYFRYAWEMEELKDNVTNAISIAQKFIEITDEKKYVGDLVYAYNFLERVQLDLGNNKEALYYNTKTSKAAIQSSNIDMFMVTQISKASIYRRLHREEEAFILLDSLNKISCSIDSKRQLYRGYGVLNFYEGNFKKASKYYKDVIQLTKKQYQENKTNQSEIEYNYNLLESYTNISEAYLELKDYKLTEKYLDSTKSNITINSYQPFVDFYYSLRFLLNYRTKENEKAVLREYEELIRNNKKRHQKKVNEKLYALTLANEKEKIAITEKNETEINNIKLIASLGILGLLMLIGYLFFRQRRYRFQKQEMQMQQRLLRSQMNSHFTFNTLSVIQNEIKENQEIATGYLLKFSRLLRLTLTNSLYNYVEVQDELEVLRKYLDLQLFRFPNEFEYIIKLENFEEDDLLFIPPMLIQPFIENSIEHGVSKINYKGEIIIKLTLIDKYIYCVIEDNGIGLNESKNIYKESVSTNLIFNFIYKATKQKVRVLDKKNQNLKDSGVIVEFLIPYKFSEYD